MIIPIKIAMPPIEGVSPIWIFLPPGLSMIFFFLKKPITSGVTKKVSINEVIKLARV
jgi:hypothetical protein